MAMKKWAMVIMNAGYDPEKDMARLDLEQVETHILTVRNPEEAVALAKRLGEEALEPLRSAGLSGRNWQRKCMSHRMQVLWLCDHPPGPV